MSENTELESSPVYEAALEKMLSENPKIRELSREIINICGDSADELLECECVEFGGKRYIILQEFKVGSKTYFYMVREDDAADCIFRKMLTIGNEAYLVEITSEKEYRLARKHFLKLLVEDMKGITD